MSNWIKVVAAVLMVLALVVIGCAPKQAAPAPEKTITVGILGALTGPLRVIGQGAIACNDYFTYLNDTQGGIKYNDPKTGKEEVVKVVVILGDHAWDAAKSLSLYERFKLSGMQYVFSNGSAPGTAIYAACARDFIPGQQIDCTSDPFIYELPEPYLALCSPSMPVAQASIVGWYAKFWKKPATGNLKLALLAADVSTRRVYDNDAAFGFLTYCKDVAKVDLIGPIYIPVAPIDVKGELSRVIDAGANIVLVDHWGDGACRVVLNNAIELGMHKKGIDLNIEWMGSNVTSAEAAKCTEYNKSAHFGVMTHGWGGGESPAIIQKYPGLKLGFDLCLKYHNTEPGPIGGWQYIYGVKEAMIGADVFKRTLERTGYDGFNGKEMRKTLFGLQAIDTLGLIPKYDPDPKVFMTWPFGAIADVNEKGYHVADPVKFPWLGFTGLKIYPGLKTTILDPEWQDKIYFPPSL